MKIQLRKITKSSLFIEDLNIYKQFNISKIIRFNKYRNYYKYKRERFKIYDINMSESIIKINNCKFIDTLKGRSLEDQILTGRASLIVGSLNFNLLVKYGNCYFQKSDIRAIEVPFSQILIVPLDFKNIEIINLRYLIEDVALSSLDKDSFMINNTVLLQMLEKSVAQ